MVKSRKVVKARKVATSRTVATSRKTVRARKVVRARKAATSRIGRRPSTKRTKRVGTRQRERTPSTNRVVGTRQRALTRPANRVVDSRPAKAEGTRSLNEPSSLDAIKHPKILTKSYEMFRTWIALYVCASTARF